MRSGVTGDSEPIVGHAWVRLGATRLPQWLTGIGCMLLSLPLVGWLLGVPVLRGFGDPDYVIAPLTAINGCSVTLTGFLAVSGRPRLARIAFAPAAILLTLIGLRYLTDAIPVERLFFADSVARLGVANHGISPGGTALVQAVGGLAAFAITSDRRTFRVLGIVLSSAAVALTLLAATALFTAQGNASPSFLGRSLLSTAVALLPLAGLNLYAARLQANEPGWHLLVQLAPAIIILPAIPSLVGLAAYQSGLLSVGAAQFLVLTGNVLILAGVLMRAIGHADAQGQVLANRKAKLRAVLEMVPDAVVLIDEYGVINDFSRAAELLWGYRADQVIGRPITILGKEAHAERYRQGLAAIRDAEPGPIPVEPLNAVGQRSDGSLFPIEVRVGRVVVADAPWLTIFVRDMSAQFSVEDQVAQLNAELAHLARQSAMGEAAADLAHELNQPLAAAANYLSAVAMQARQQQGGTPALEMVNRAREQVMHAGEIIRRLRSFTEHNDTERSAELLRPMIEDAARLVLVGSSKLAAQIEYEVVPADLRVFVDRVQIQQVLVNLLRNAVEALRSSRRDNPRIWVTARALEDHMVEVRCCDNGPGLSEETLARLFERFSASDSGGMGIGLAISKRIVEIHGGVFTAANAPQGGAVFTFTLPTLDADIGAG